MNAHVSPAGPDVSSSEGFAADELRQLIERPEEEKAAIAGDIKEVMAELKGRGFF